MKIRCSPHDQPWRWLLRELTLIGLLAMTARAVIAYGLRGIPELFLFIGLLGFISVLTLRMVAEILVAGFCGWTRAMGGGLGSMVASIRDARRCDRASHRTS